jgi:hypothetical protein
LAGLTALVDVNSAVTLAVLLYLVILIKGGLSPARKLERFETRRAWSCLSDRAKTLLLGPKTVEINAEGISMESAMYHTFWRWEVIGRLVKTVEGVIFTLVTDRAEPRVYIPKRAFADQEEMRLFQLECERLANKIFEQGEKPEMPPVVRKRDQVRNT